MQLQNKGTKIQEIWELVKKKSKTKRNRERKRNPGQRHRKNIFNTIIKDFLTYQGTRRLENAK